MTEKRTAAALAVLLLAGACESYSPTREEIGVATGAIVGGVLGHQVGGGRGNALATVGGAALGAFVGGRIGSRMDREDEQRTAKVLESSPIGQTVTWRNPDSGGQYAVTPVRTYSRATGAVCRDFTTTTIIDGKQELVHATACRQPDGTWKAS